MRRSRRKGQLRRTSSSGAGSDPATRADSPGGRAEGGKAELAGWKEDLLVGGGIVGVVLLAEGAAPAAAGADHARGVVVDARRPPLEDGGDHDGAHLLRDPAERVGGRA